MTNNSQLIITLYWIQLGKSELEAGSKFFYRSVQGNLKSVNELLEKLKRLPSKF